MRKLYLLLIFTYSILEAQFITPTWESTWLGGGSFSSGRATDLNNDGIDDIIVGAGIEDSESDLGIIAINGLNGDTLWTKGSRNQIYSSAIFGASFDSSFQLVYLAGRDAQLLCLNAINGNIIWEFWPDSLGSAEASGWLNFYNPRIIENDHLLVTNGGLATASSGDPNRPPGKLMILNRFDGTILFMDTMPDGSETYFTPMLWPLSEIVGGNLIVLGTGGETLPGSLWAVGLEDFKQDGLSKAEALLTDLEKGFIQAPAFADLNSDGEYDILAPRINEGGLIALDGLTKEIIWSFELPNTENYTSPVIGDFSGDGLPDIFGIFAKGEFPIYFEFYAYLIDGQNGLPIYTETLPIFQFNSGNALDWDQDGVDELLLIQNEGAGPRGIKHAFRIFDFNDDTTYFITEYRSGSVAFPTPLISDMDDDGLLEILYVFDPGSSSSGEIAKTGFGRYDLDLPSDEVSWAGYLGTFEDGTYRKNMDDSTNALLSYGLNIFPNPASNRLRIIDSEESIVQILMIDPLGRYCDIEFEKLGKNYLINTSRLAHGLYILKVSDGKREIIEKILIE